MNMKANRRLLKLVWTRIAIELPNNCYKRTSDLGCEGELVKEMTLYNYKRKPVLGNG